MCNQFPFHHQFGIDTGRSKFEQQTDCILSASWIPWTKNIRILTRSTWKHRVLHKTCMKHGKKKHRNTVYWVDIDLALKKGLKFDQTRSNAIFLHETLPAYCTPEVVRMETGEVIHEKVFASPRRPPKISFKHDWMKELGSEVAQRPDGEVVQQSKCSQSSQPNQNPDHEKRCNQLFVVTQVTRKVHPKHVHLLMSQIMIDGWLRAINNKRSCHWLQNTRIATFCGETSWENACSWIGQETTLTDNLFNKIYKFETDPQCKECQSCWSEGIVILERKCSQPRRHPKNIGHSLNSRVHNWEGTTSWPIWENSREERISSGQWRCLYQMGRFCRQRFLSSPDRSRIFSIQQNWKHWTIEKSFWLQRSVVCIKPFTPRIWRTTTQTDAFLEVPGTAPIDFSSSWWQWSGSWWSKRNR